MPGNGLLAQKHLQMQLNTTQHDNKTWLDRLWLLSSVLFHPATWVFVFLFLHRHNVAHFLILACLRNLFLFYHTRLDTYLSLGIRMSKVSAGQLL